MNQRSARTDTTAEAPLRVAVVGAGLAGLTAARALVDKGHEVVVVEKARGPGGRMSTRRQGDLRFDHGAQYFTARDPRFLRQLMAWRERGLAQSWPARIAVVGAQAERGAGVDTERFVGVPGMSAICSAIAAELPDCRFGWQAESASYDGMTWRLDSREGFSLQADALIVTAPPPQAAALLDDSVVAAALEGVKMAPCWSVMALFAKPLLRDWDAAFVNEGPLSWVSGQASRPGRPAAEAWVLHAGPDWSGRHLEDDAEAVQHCLLAAARELPIAQPAEALFARAHRWRYALARRPLEDGVLWFDAQRLALAGDWCHGSRVEGAYLSGLAAAGRILGADFART